MVISAGPVRRGAGTVASELAISPACCRRKERLARTAWRDLPFALARVRRPPAGNPAPCCRAS